MNPLLRFRHSNPQRPPAWRWQRAQFLQKNKLHFGRSRDDQYVARARQFAIALDNAKDELQQCAVSEQYPDIYEAWALYVEDDYKDARWELEARILAREPRAQIAQKTGLSETAIEYYGLLYFDVEDRLSQHSYITTVVIGHPATPDAGEHERERLWKLFGYSGGTHLLDLLVYGFDRSARPQTSAEIADFLNEDIDQQLRLQTAMAVRSMPANSKAKSEILKLFRKMRESEQQAGHGNRKHHNFQREIQGLLESLPWTRDAAKALKHGLIDKKDRGGMGLRADEQLLVAAGQEPPDLDLIQKTAVYPAPIHRTTVSS